MGGGAQDASTPAKEGLGEVKVAEEVEEELSDLVLPGQITEGPDGEDALVVRQPRRCLVCTAFYKQAPMRRDVKRAGISPN